MKSLKAFLVLLSITLAASVLSAQVENPDPNGGGSGGGGCSKCYVRGNLNGTMSMSCGAPEPGTMGMQYCYIESDGNESYCLTGGNQCCVD